MDRYTINKVLMLFTYDHFFGAVSSFWITSIEFQVVLRP